MIRNTMALAIGFSTMAVMAQMTPVGTWNSVDDKTKEIKSEIVIADNAGALSGKITKVMRKDFKPEEVCDKCSDDRKDKPILGLEIIRGAKKVEGKEVWEDGKILDPENGKNYTLRLSPTEGGSKLEVRGSVFGIGRTQTWTRIQ